MTTYRITPLHLGTIIRKKSNMLYHCGSDSPVEFPIVACLLQGGGRNILVDTGGSAPGTKWMPYERPEEQSLSAQLKKHGVMPEDITDVLFTHLHWDHAGGNDCLRNAKFHVQRAEYEQIAEGELPGVERELIMRCEYELIDGDREEYLPGISVMLTPGHSLGSQTVLVNTEEGMLAIAGDLIPTYENIERGLPNGGTYDVETITKSMQRVLALGCKILPGHDLAG